MIIVLISKLTFFTVFVRYTKGALEISLTRLCVELFQGVRLVFNLVNT